jgi:hypothetical protein
MSRVNINLLHLNFIHRGSLWLLPAILLSLFFRFMLLVSRQGFKRYDNVGKPSGKSERHQAKVSGKTGLLASKT